MKTLLKAFLASHQHLPAACLNRQHAKLAITHSVYAFTGPSQSTLDNWSHCTLDIGQFTFHTSEHVIFAVAKAGYFQDQATLVQALACPPDTSPRDSKALGRCVAGFDARAWAEASLWISDLVLLLKALQNPGVAHELLATDERIICEASRTDKIWGVGMDARNPLVGKPGAWKGRNELGRSWMRVRNYLKKGIQRGQFDDGEEGMITTQQNVDMFFSWFEGMDGVQQRESEI